MLQIQSVILNTCALENDNFVNEYDRGIYCEYFKALNLRIG